MGTPSARVSPPPHARSSRANADAMLRIGRYTVGRAISLFATIVVGVYLSILIANMGGYVDEIRRGQIREFVSSLVLIDQELQSLPVDARNQLINEQIRLEEERLGLHRPFAVRSFMYLGQALTLDLGRAENMTSDSGSRQVRLILLERLVPTLLLFATAQIALFFVAIFIALNLSRNYGSLLDRIIVALSPTSAAPSWFYGLFLILIFSAIFRVMPFGGMVAAPPPETTVGYALSVLKHMTLPVAAIVLGALFQTVYSWRSFFLIYSSEDYVEMATAKGLTAREVELGYVLRPTLPTIVTSFALTLISLWTGAIVLETVFSWPGLGRVLIQAIGLYDTPVIVGSVVVYAYLLALTVFVLDVLYAFIDPRVRVGVGS